MKLEPMKNWIQTAQDAGKIAVSGSPQEKKALAAQVFGSNLFLDCKKACGSSVKPWSFILETTVCGGMVGWAGLEPRDQCLKRALLYQLSYQPIMFKCKQLQMFFSGEKLNLSP